MNDKTKSAAGRTALPKEKRLSVTIQERVNQTAFDDFAKLGGKPFLLEVISLRAIEYVPGLRIKAKFIPLGLDPQNNQPTTFDVTHAILAMGKDSALKLSDESEAARNLRKSTYAPDWIQKWAGPFEIKIVDDVRNYYGESHPKEDERTAQLSRDDLLLIVRNQAKELERLNAQLGLNN